MGAARERSVDVVVIGAGAMGSAAAWALARQGVEVLLLEQFEQGHTRGSSHGDVRIFRRAYTDPFYVSLVAEALDDWRALEDDAGEPLLDLVGVLDHGDPEVVGDVAAAMAAARLPAEVLTVGEAEARFPQYRFDRMVLHLPDGGRCRAAATLRALARRAAHHGADVRFGTGPVAFDVVADDRVTVRWAGGEMRTRTVVVTAGAWVRGLLGGRIALPALRLAEEQVVHVPVAGRSDGDATGWPCLIHRTGADRLGVGYYALVTPGVGLKLGGHLEGRVADPDHRSTDAEAATQFADDLDGCRQYAEAWLPGVRPEPILGPRCLFTYTESHDFVLDRVGPVVVGSPCSGHGFKFTPLVGRLLADLALGRPGRPRFSLAAGRS